MIMSDQRGRAYRHSTRTSRQTLSFSSSTSLITWQSLSGASTTENFALMIFSRLHQSHENCLMGQSSTWKALVKRRISGLALRTQPYAKRNPSGTSRSPLNSSHKAMIETRYCSPSKSWRSVSAVLKALQATEAMYSLRASHAPWLPSPSFLSPTGSISA